MAQYSNFDSETKNNSESFGSGLTSIFGKVKTKFSNLFSINNEDGREELREDINRPFIHENTHNIYDAPSLNYYNGINSEPSNVINSGQQDLSSHAVSEKKSDKGTQKFCLTSPRNNSTKKKVNPVIKISTYITNCKFNQVNKTRVTSSNLLNKKSAFNIIDKAYKNIELDAKKIINFNDFFKVKNEKNIIKPFPIRKPSELVSSNKKRKRDQDHNISVEMETSQGNKRRRIIHEDERSIFSSNISRARNAYKEDVSMNSMRSIPLVSPLIEKQKKKIEDTSMKFRHDTRSHLSKSYESKTLDEIKKEIEEKRSANKKMFDEISKRSSRRSREGVYDYEEKRRILTNYYKQKEKSFKELELKTDAIKQSSNIVNSSDEFRPERKFTFENSSITIPSSQKSTRNQEVVVEKKDVFEISSETKVNTTNKEFEQNIPKQEKKNEENKVEKTPLTEAESNNLTEKKQKLEFFPKKVEEKVEKSDDKPTLLFDSSKHFQETKSIPLQSFLNMNKDNATQEQSSNKTLFQLKSDEKKIIEKKEVIQNNLINTSNNNLFSNIKKEETKTIDPKPLGLFNKKIDEISSIPVIKENLREIPVLIPKDGELNQLSNNKESLPITPTFQKSTLFSNTTPSKELTEKIVGDQKNLKEELATETKQEEKKAATLFPENKGLLTSQGLAPSNLFSLDKNKTLSPSAEITETKSISPSIAATSSTSLYNNNNPFINPGINQKPSFSVFGAQIKQDNEKQQPATESTLRINQSNNSMNLGNRGRGGDIFQNVNMPNIQNAPLSNLTNNGNLFNTSMLSKPTTNFKPSNDNDNMSVSPIMSPKLTSKNEDTSNYKLLQPQSGILFNNTPTIFNNNAANSNSMFNQNTKILGGQTQGNLFSNQSQGNNVLPGGLFQPQPQGTNGGMPLGGLFGGNQNPTGIQTSGLKFNLGKK